MGPQWRQVGEHPFLLGPATSPTSYCGCPAQMSSSSRVRRSPIPWPGVLTVVSRKVSHSSVKILQ